MLTAETKVVTVVTFSPIQNVGSFHIIFSGRISSISPCRRSAMPAIEILGLEKTYLVGFWRKHPKRALHPLHLTVEEGEIFGFLGPTGAGRTTTLKMLMGLVFPTSGTARILGREWTDPEIKAQIGF